MKKIVLTSLLAIFTATAAGAAVNPYASLKLGYADNNGVDVIYQDEKIGEFDGIAGFTGSAAGGASFDVYEMVGMRAELEYTYLNAEQDRNTDPLGLVSHSFMINGYADFGDASWMVKPYVGLGAGYTFGQLSNNSVNEHVAGISYAVSGGITYAVSSNVVMDLGVKYTMQDLAWSKHTDLEYDTPVLSFLLGARYMF